MTPSPTRKRAGRGGKISAEERDLWLNKYLPTIIGKGGLLKSTSVYWQDGVYHREARGNPMTGAIDAAIRASRQEKKQ